MPGRGPRKGRVDIAREIRGAFLRACKMTEEDGRPLSMIILGLLNEDPKGCLDAIAKFVPKELMMEMSIVDQIEDMSEEAIDDEIRRLAAKAGAVFAAEGEGDKTQH